MIVEYPKNFKFFLKKVSLFFLPIMAIFLILEVLAFYSGELKPIKEVINLQSYGGKEIIFGREIADQSIRKYKYKNEF